MKGKGFMYKLKRAWLERFWTFEAFNGGFIFIPWGWGFFYYGFPWTVDVPTMLVLAQKPSFGYNYALMSLGLVLMVWGLRKLLVNRVKQAAAMQTMVEERMADDAVKP
jgi:hypothetical protein